MTKPRSGGTHSWRNRSMGNLNRPRTRSGSAGNGGSCTSNDGMLNGKLGNDGGIGNEIEMFRLSKPMSSCGISGNLKLSFASRSGSANGMGSGGIWNGAEMSKIGKKGVAPGMSSMSASPWYKPSTQIECHIGVLVSSFSASSWGGTQSGKSG